MPYDTGNNDTVEKLLRAKQLLIERGWVQYTFCNQQNGAHCLGGAIIASQLGQAQIVDREGTALLEQAAELLGFYEGTGELFRWNDTVGRTINDVIERLDAAITRELEK